MTSRQEQGFSPDQFVIASIREAGLVDELAYVDKPIPGSYYEVVFLRDHKVGCGADPIRVFSGIRPATKDETLTKKSEWEKRNNYTLGFGVAETEEGRVLIAELTTPQDHTDSISP